MRKLPPVSDVGSTARSLIVGMRSDDAEAWSRFVRIYGPWVHFLLERRSKLSPEDAEDVFIDVFETVRKGIEKFRKDRPEDSFRGWLRTVVRTRTIDFVRRREKQERARGGSTMQGVLGAIAIPDESDEPDERDAVRQMRLRAIELLRPEIEPRTWEMFWAVSVEGAAAKEVAEKLGTTASNVRLAKSRVLRRLREMLDGLESEAFVGS